MDVVDHDEAEPEMVDSALSGGSPKTSGPPLCLDCFTQQFAEALCNCCSTGHGLTDDSFSLEASSPLNSPVVSTASQECEQEDKPDEEAETFEDFISSLLGDHLRSPIEVLNFTLHDEVNEEEVVEVTTERLGRKSAEDGKHTAFSTPVMQALEAISFPCNNLCPLSGFCTKHVSAPTIFEMRNLYFSEAGNAAPKDKERAEIILGYLRKAKKDSDNNLIFTLDGKDVCTPAFLRMLGVTSSVDMTKIPGQWQRLIKGFLATESSDYLLSPDELKQDLTTEFTEKRGHAKAFANDIASFFSDTIPAVTADDGFTKTMVVPFRNAKDFHREYTFHCDASGIGPQDRASYPTFVRAINTLRDGKVIKFLGGKSGFQTCSICNNTLAIKKSLCCKRDEVTKDALLKINRLHLSQQSSERQFADNFAFECEKLEDGQPIKAHLDFDGQSVWAGNTPVWTRDRESKPDSIIENRNIGVKITCGPVKEYISVCTNNLIPHGANVVVEVVKYAIEYLAKRLQEHSMVLPKKVGIQGDNSGENKVNIYFNT